jgi:hypothetical protein
MKLGLNKKQLIPLTVGLVVAQNLPLIASKLGLPASGFTGNAVTAIGGIALGKVFKKPDIGNVAVAFAIADILNTQFISSMIASFGGTTPPTTPPMLLQSRLGRRLGAYTSYPTVTTKRNVGFYENYN